MRTRKFNLSKLSLCLLLASSFLAASCSGPGKLAKRTGKAYIKSESEVLEVHGDSITVTIKCAIPPYVFSKNAIIKLGPELSYGGQETPLKPLILKGEKVKAVYDGSETVNYSHGLTFNYVRRVAYTPEMRNSVLSIYYKVKTVSKYEELSQCAGGTADTVLGAVTTSLLVKRTDDIYQKFHNDETARSTKTIVFYFEQNDPELGHHIYSGESPDEKAARELEEANTKALNAHATAELKEIMAAKNLKINNVVLRGYASPDGAISRNAELCKLRSENGERAVRDEFKNMGLASAYGSAFINRPDKDDDWNGLKYLVNKSDMAGKDDILSIINSNLDFNSKNEALKRLPSWKYLTENILPELRRTEVVINGTFPLRKYEEISQAPLDSLSPGEVLTVAQNTADTVKKMEIYKYYNTKYPDDWAGFNNYAAMLLYMHKDEDAHKILAGLAKQYPDNDTIQNNLGVANRCLHHYDEAKENYKTAEKGGMNEDNNMGILYIKYGRYANAIDRFDKNKYTYNLALAYCLKGDYLESLKKIERMGVSLHTADVYYLKAIDFARLKDKTNMLANLSQALNMNPRLWEPAKTDLEFRHFKATPEFQGIIMTAEVISEKQRFGHINDTKQNSSYKYKNNELNWDLVEKNISFD